MIIEDLIGKMTLEEKVAQLGLVSIEDIRLEGSFEIVGEKREVVSPRTLFTTVE